MKYVWAPALHLPFYQMKAMKGWWLKVAWSETPPGILPVFMNLKEGWSDSKQMSVYMTPEQTSLERRGKFQEKAVNCFNSFHLGYHKGKSLNIKCLCCGLNRTGGFMWELPGEIQTEHCAGLQRICFSLPPTDGQWD